MAHRITALIPCKNERLNIRPCIESVRAVADEILVADSGSTDGTLDIVRGIRGCRIIERHYVNSANFKNWAIPHASHQWVLLVDADERVTPALAAEIRRMLESSGGEVDAYSIRRLNHYLGHRIRRCGWERDRVIRLFRRDACRYRQRWVHAEIDIEPGRVSRLREPMLHFTTWTTDHYLEKLNRYAHWGALNSRDESRRLSLTSMVLVAPLRFLQLYFLRGGVFDGVAGFQVCMFAAFYSFLKKAKQWEMRHAIPQPDPETEYWSRATLNAPSSADDEQASNAA